MTKDKQKRNLKSKKTRRKLLRAAEAEFVKKGFDGARVDEISKRAGVNKGMIYLNFRSKEALYIEVLKGSFESLFESAQYLVAEGENPVEDTQKIIKWYFWFLSEHPEFVRLFEWETLETGTRAADVILGLMEKGLGPLQEIIKRGKKQGYFKEDLAVHKIVTLINEMCLGFFSRKRLFEVLWKQDLSAKENQQKMLDHIIEVTIGGIVTKKSSH